MAQPIPHGAQAKGKEREPEVEEWDGEAELEKDFEVLWAAYEAEQALEREQEEKEREQEKEEEEEPEEEVWDGEAELEKDFEELWAEWEAEQEREREQGLAALEAELEEERQHDEARQRARNGDRHDERARRFEEAIREAELEFEREANQVQDAAPSKCTACGKTADQLIFLTTERHESGAKQLVSGGDRKPYCIGCTELLGLKWLNREGELDRLTQEQLTMKLFRYLVRHSLRRGLLILADHFRICRCCLKAATPEGAAPGEPCDACWKFQRCGCCGRFSRLVARNEGGFLCVICAQEAKRNSLRIGSKGSRRADWVTGKTARVPKCLECSEPTDKARMVYCSRCRDHLLNLPGDKCTKCKIQPRPDGYKTCQHCRAKARKDLGKPE